MTLAVTTYNQITMYGNQVDCMPEAIPFYATLPTYADINERQQRIDMSGPATDQTIDYLGNHLHRLSSNIIRAEIEALDAQIATFAKMDYAWAEATLYDLQGVRMVLEDAMTKLEGEGN